MGGEGGSHSPPLMAGRLAWVYTTLYPHEIFHSYAAVSHFSPFRARLGLRQSHRYQFHMNALKAYHGLIADAARGHEVIAVADRLSAMTMRYMRDGMYDADVSKLIKLVEDPPAAPDSH